MHRLAVDAGSLDVHATYVYLLLARDFADTCLVCVDPEGALRGFVTAYRRPEAPDALFIWQVGVCPTARRQGLALRMLRALLDRFDQSVRHVEATIAPSNDASLGLFRKLAEDQGGTFRDEPLFTADHFDESHEDEHLIIVTRGDA